MILERILTSPPEPDGGGSENRARPRTSSSTPSARDTSTREAARQSGASRSALFYWRTQDDAFARDWQDAYQEGNDAIVQEIKRRGMDGVDKPVYRGGRQVGTVREYSVSFR